MVTHDSYFCYAVYFLFSEQSRHDTCLERSKLSHACVKFKGGECFIILFLLFSYSHNYLPTRPFSTLGLLRSSGAFTPKWPARLKKLPVDREYLVPINLHSCGKYVSPPSTFVTAPDWLLILMKALHAPCLLGRLIFIFFLQCCFYWRPFFLSFMPCFQHVHYLSHKSGVAVQCTLTIFLLTN